MLALTLPAEHKSISTDYYSLIAFIFLFAPYLCQQIFGWPAKFRNSAGIRLRKRKMKILRQVWRIPVKLGAAAAHSYTVR